MTLVTKFNVGDKVYFMKDNKPYSDTIQQITTTTKTNSIGLEVTTIEYRLKVNSVCDQKELYKSKEQLIESL